MSAATTNADPTQNTPEAAGHPPGLFLLFFVEMWERFSFYGMRALLTFYLIKGFLQANDERAYAIYGAYGALVYATPYIGGIFADKYLGARLSVIWGGVLMSAGHLLMGVEQEWALFGALALLIVGNGFFKPNISTMVGSLYPEGSAKRDGGFTIFYMGINLGAALAPLVCGYIGETYGWHYGFGLATAGMLLGLATFMTSKSVSRVLILVTSAGVVGTMLWATRDDIPQLIISVPIALAAMIAAGYAFWKLGHGDVPADLGLPRDAQGKVTKPRHAPAILGGSLVAVLPLAFLVNRNELATWVLNLVGVVAFGWILYTAFASEKVERDRLFVILVLCFFSMLFWSFFEQAGSSLNNFTDRNIDRVVGSSPVVAGQTYSNVPVTQEFLGIEVAGKRWTLEDISAAEQKRLAREEGGTISFTATSEHVERGLAVQGSELKASVFQATNPLFILLFAPFFSWLWTWLGRRDPSAGVKFALGLAQLALGFGCLWIGAKQADSNGMVALVWLVLSYLLQTTGEICLSPVGLSLVTKLAPAKIASTIMGAWFLATSFSHIVAAAIAKMTGVSDGGGGDAIPPPTETVHIYGNVFGYVGLTAMVAAVALLALSPWLRARMHLDDATAAGRGGGH